MSTISYAWQAHAPIIPDVYTTRRNESKYLTMRYWDGARWYSLDYGGSRGGLKGDVFKWPKKSATRRPSWVVKYAGTLRLRKIGTGQGAIQWGIPFKVFDEREVLAHLVKTGVLPVDWKMAFQAEMRLTGVAK